jgi:hypothetical protein
MASLGQGELIVATGTFLYAGAVECNVRIMFSPIRYGSGDDADEPEIADDVAADTYYVQYGSTTEPGGYNAGTSGYSSLAEARAAALADLGTGAALHWNDDAP